MLKVLIVEDESHNREALIQLITRLGHECDSAVDGMDALEKVSNKQFQLILSDVRMPRMDGLQFMDAYRQLLPLGTNLPPFVFMTAYGRLQEAVGAMKKGALNFLTKPLRKKDIASLLEEAEKYWAVCEKSDQGKSFGQLDQAIYSSRVFGDVIQLVDKVASSLASVHFVGESGSGKEVLARRLHQKSARADGPFVAFHAGAVPETLMESHLFGHAKGAFTGADRAQVGQIPLADKGTFFLDELSSMPLNTQTKLLRVIQDRKVQPLGSTESVNCDVRWVSAANVSLEEQVKRGEFREDLLYRLSVVVIEIPPLRDRVEDLDTLSKYFIEEFSSREGKSPLQINDQVKQMLQNYSWPGNVRELRNVIERAVVLSTEDTFTPELLPAHISHSDRAREIRLAVGSSLKSAEDQLIEETLKSCDGDKNKAASILGIAPRTIYRWIERRDSLSKD